MDREVVQQQMDLLTNTMHRLCGETERLPIWQSNTRQEGTSRPGGLPEREVIKLIWTGKDGVALFLFSDGTWKAVR